MWDSPELCSFNLDFQGISLATHVNSLWDLVKACYTIIEQHYSDSRLDRDLMAAGVFLRDVSISCPWMTNASTNVASASKTDPY